jgi:uncharacterized Zn finger protein (UPF0148 family)
VTTCSSCGKEVERANLINGQVYCAACTYAEEYLPKKNVERDFRNFAQVKRRNRQWR